MCLVVLNAPWSQSASGGELAPMLPIVDGGAINLECEEYCGVFRSPTGYSNDTGFAWQYSGVSSGVTGAFAECFHFDAPVTVCSIALNLSQLGQYGDQRCEGFIWADASGQPGSVLAMDLETIFGFVETWPYVSCHFLRDFDTCVQGDVWIGARGVWAGDVAGWFVAADLESGNGCPMTNVAPGIGYPSGWQPVSEIWQSTASLGIWAIIIEEPCILSPTYQSSWGRIKSLYRVLEK